MHLRSIVSFVVMFSTNVWLLTELLSWYYWRTLLSYLFSYSFCLLLLTLIYLSLFSEVIYFWALLVDLSGIVRLIYPLLMRLFIFTGNAIIKVFSNKSISLLAIIKSNYTSIFHFFNTEIALWAVKSKWTGTMEI